MMGGMASSIVFAAAARRLADEARRRGLAVPGFRSPPRVSGAVRTLRRQADGAAVVAVRLRDRAPDEVVADMVDGLLVANRLAGSEAERCRAELLHICGDAQAIPMSAMHPRGGDG